MNRLIDNYLAALLWTNTNRSCGSNDFGKTDKLTLHFRSSVDNFIILGLFKADYFSFFFFFLNE